MVKVESGDLHLQDNEVLSSDLIGFEVVHKGKKIGTIASIENYGASDFFEIAVDGQGFVLLPNEDDFIVKFNERKNVPIKARNMPSLSLESLTVEFMVETL